MEFSIIIPAKNEEKCLPGLLEGLKRQKEYRWGEDFEVIVLDGYSSDRTAEIAKSYGCKVRKTKEWPIGKVRNIGASIAKGKYLVFLDADDEVLPTALSDIKKTLQKHPAALFSVGTGSLFETLYSSIANFLARLFPSDIHPGGGVAVRADFFKEIGGFNESMTTMEDRNLLRRLKRAGKGSPTIMNSIRTSPRRYRDIWSLVMSEFYVINVSHKYWELSVR